MKHTITLIILLTIILVITPMDQKPPTPIRPTPLHRAITPPPPPSRPPTPPILGITGLSAFAPYTRARLQTTTAPSTQPRPPFYEGGSSSSIHYRPPTGFGTGYHWFPPSFLGAQALMMAGGGGIGRGGAVVATALGLGGGGSSPASRKRGLDKGGVTGPGGSPGKGGAGPYHRERVNCSICNKEFGSSKALFGHMRSHPDRGWKGAHPPPIFRASEDFADLGPLFRPHAPTDQPDPVAAPATVPAPAPTPAQAVREPALTTPAQAFPPPEPAAPVPAPPATGVGEEGVADVAEEGAAAGGAGGRFIPDLND